MYSSLASHQNDLHNAFAWIEFAYKEGNSLLEAAKRRLADEAALKFFATGTCNTYKRSVSHRYTWLDVDWYISESDERPERALFVAMSYSSEDRVGCYLILGVCDLDRSGSALIDKPTQLGHWLIDYAVNSSSSPGKFLVRERSDGLFEYTPGVALEPGYRIGLHRIISAPFAVAWIDSETKLSAIVHALVTFFTGAETDELGRHCREARAALAENT